MMDFKSTLLACRETSLFFAGQAGFIVKSKNGQMLAIDLYLSNCVERLEGNKGFKRLLPQIMDPSDVAFDVIIATHPHLDHFDIDAIPEMMSKGSRLFCSVECERLIHQNCLDYYENSITYVRPNDSIVIGDFELLFVKCDHGKAAPDAVGVVITVDGKTIYEVGDSCLRLDWVKDIHKSIDVLITPINGMYGNMNSEEAVQFAEALNPGLVIPCHYGMFASHGGDLKAFYDLTVAKGIQTLIMQMGERYIL